jgi:Protein of unknown function (DUF998)
MLLTCGAIGGPLFIAVFLIEGATRKGYDPWREPVSALALGSRGWTQQTNFIVTGLLMLAFARGLRHAADGEPGGPRWGPRLIGAYAIGLIGAGVFVTDPVRNLGESSPAAPGLHGTLHNVFSMQVFAALGAAGLSYARWFARRGEHRWAICSSASGVLVPGGIVLFGRALSQTDGLGRIAGLIQRLTIALGWGWLVALAVYLIRRDTGG